MNATVSTTQWALAIVAFAVMGGFALLLFEAVGEACWRFLGRLKHKMWRGL